MDFLEGVDIAWEDIEPKASTLMAEKVSAAVATQASDAITTAVASAKLSMEEYFDGIRLSVKETKDENMRAYLEHLTAYHDSVEKEMKTLREEIKELKGGLKSVADLVSQTKRVLEQNEAILEMLSKVAAKGPDKHEHILQIMPPGPMKRTMTKTVNGFEVHEVPA